MLPGVSCNEQKANNTLTRKSCPYELPNKHSLPNRISTPYNFDSIYDDISNKDPTGFQKIQEIWSKSDEGGADPNDTKDANPFEQAKAEPNDKLKTTQHRYTLGSKTTQFNPYYRMSQGSYPYPHLASPFEYYMPEVIIMSSLENAKDPNGSRKLQQQIEKATKEEYLAILHDLLPSMIDLIPDAYGNYVVQKLLDFANTECKDSVLQVVKSHVFTFSTNSFACRVIQKLIEVLPLEGQLQIYTEIKYYIAKMVDDTNANHVIQKCIEKIPHMHIEYIVMYFINNVRT